ncbi:AraC family transcriptional regulator [uncultured Martelella sp.]|uniref:AraC family transcriptional regulator n=1 Tax=uncultured Martelella sp. TaxID=392331 RepID=UPI0029C9280D|nr:AraC family transcriptional regulator [uncultured Martelella sp.]
MELRNCADMLLQQRGQCDGMFDTAIPGLMLMRHRKPTRPQCILYRPSLCLILQGAKEVTLGQARCSYRQDQSLIVTAEMPTLGHVVEASTARPFIGFGLELDIDELRRVAERLSLPKTQKSAGDFRLFVQDTEKAVEECLVRLITASDRPAAMTVLRPAIMNEIYYWLLTGPCGHQIARQIALAGAAGRIATAIELIRDAFDRPFAVENLASQVGMSPSSFYTEFKRVTSMTPLQFQKQLRLSEARRLLTGEAATVGSVAFQVGYQSASQFSREYTRMFGLPPARDAALSRAAGSRSAPTEQI